jgi:hypothetical protein
MQSGVTSKHLDPCPAIFSSFHYKQFAACEPKKFQVLFAKPSLQPINTDVPVFVLPRLNFFCPPQLLHKFPAARGQAPRTSQQSTWRKIFPHQPMV